MSTFTQIKLIITVFSIVNVQKKGYIRVWKRVPVSIIVTKKSHEAPIFLLHKFLLYTPWDTDLFSGRENLIVKILYCVFAYAILEKQTEKLTSLIGKDTMFMRAIFMSLFFLDSNIFIRLCLFHCSPFVLLQSRRLQSFLLIADQFFFSPENQIFCLCSQKHSEQFHQLVSSWLFYFYHNFDAKNGNFECAME